jgi:ribose transport system substrate-binding protein
LIKSRVEFGISTTWLLVRLSLNPVFFTDLVTRPKEGSMRRVSRLAALVVVVGAALAVGVALSAASPARSGGVPVPKGYKGVEATLPTSYPRPVKKSGVSCTIGFQNPIAANETLHTLQLAVVAQAKVFGCKVIALDDQTNPDKQVSNMQQLLAQKVDAIIFYPLDPKATVPLLKQAKAQNVPVVAIDGTFGSKTAKAPYLPYIATQVWQGRDIQAFLQVKGMAAANPHGKIGLIGLGFPVPALKYLNRREAFWAKKAGLTVLGLQDNPSDDVTGGEKAGNGLVQRYRDMNGVIGYNDPSALGTVIAARGAGRTLTIVGLNGDSAGLAAVKSGKLAATVRVDPVGWGTQTVIAAYSLITKQHLPLAKIVVRPAELVTKANVGKVASWTAQVKAIR